MPTPDQVLAAARSYLGVPWKPRGRDRRGLDCGGLIRVVGIDLGLWPETVDFSAYRGAPAPRELLGLARRYLDRIAPAAAGPGDIVILSAERSAGTAPCHLAIVTRGDPLWLILSQDSLGGVAEVPHAVTCQGAVSSWWRFPAGAG